MHVARHQDAIPAGDTTAISAASGIAEEPSYIEALADVHAGQLAEHGLELEDLVSVPCEISA